MKIRCGQIDTPNPMLLLIAGLCPVLIPTNTLQNGIILGLGIAIHAMLLALLIPAIAKISEKELQFPISIALSSLIAAVYGLVIRILFPDGYTGLSPFLALIALNCFSLSVLRGSLRQESLERFPEYARSAAVFFLTIVAFAIIREMLGSGVVTLYASEHARLVLDLRNVIRIPIRLMLLPAGAFMLLGYAIAGYKLHLHAKGRRKA